MFPPPVSSNSDSSENDSFKALVRVTPHTLRHTTAMHLLQSGVEVNVIRSWLGHVSIATTNLYIEIDMAMKRKALEVCELDSPESPKPPRHSDPDLLAWLESLWQLCGPRNSNRRAP
jgi:hypothetical protein